MKGTLIVLLSLFFLNGCCGYTTMPTRVTKYSEEGYIFYGGCAWGYYNNPNYDMGPDTRGCYNEDCSLSLWR